MRIRIEITVARGRYFARVKGWDARSPEGEGASPLDAARDLRARAAYGRARARSGYPLTAPTAPWEVVAADAQRMRSARRWLAARGVREIMGE